MTVKTATDVMRRKAGTGRPAPEVGRMTTARAWKMALPRAAQDTLGIPASLLRVDESRVVSGDLAGLVPEHGLIALLEGPEERFGIAVLDASTLAGLIEATTTGRISARAPVPRAPTRTDAIIAADLLDALLEGFETGLAQVEDAPNIDGYRYAAPLVDTRAMDLALGEGPYSAFRLTLDLGGGVRQGDLLVAFPVAAKGAVPGRDASDFQKALAENVMAAPAELDALLVRLQMPLSEISGLAVGDVLKVSLAALSGVRVEAGGRPVALARLGQQGGFRALRIATLGGSGEAGQDKMDFEEAGMALALPRTDLDADAGDSGVPDLDDLPPLGGEEGPINLPPLQGDDELPDPAALPPLDAEEDGGPPDVPGPPPLSG